MMIFDTLEERDYRFTLGFAFACWLGSAYGFLQGAWPFGVAEGVWGFVALNRWRKARARARHSPGTSLPSGGERQE
ncbi:hypothetical protein EON81_29565 [bacterium]|nr:MAG: hypothetical protein EON81_29565 [bacterium]